MISKPVVIASIFHLLFFIVTLFYGQNLPLLPFTIFSMAFFIMLYLATIKSSNFYLKFASLFVYLGFYLKICLHAILAYEFVEPIGGFQGQMQEWQEFFYISSLTAFSISAAALLFEKIFRINLDLQKSDPFIFESQFLKYKHWLFIALVFSSVAIAAINTNLGITISGLAAITVLPWPLNALIGFSLYMGFNILICVYAFHESKFTQSLKYTTLLVLVEAFFSSISILSRGLFLFHFLPYLICIWTFRKSLKWQWRQLLGLCLLGGSLYLASGFLVTVTRMALYNGQKLSSAEFKSRNLFSFTNDSDRSEYFTKYNQKLSEYRDQFLKLVADRWIGAEGLMAVISYPDKNFSLITKSLVRVPKVGERDVFEDINRSTYPISTQYVFTSLPGPTAFFYYSGSGFVVFLGIFFLITIFGCLQQLTQWLVPNVFMEFQTAFYFAVAFMQFGISPRPLLISFVMLFTVLITLKTINILTRIKWK